MTSGKPDTSSSMDIGMAAKDDHDENKRKVTKEANRRHRSASKCTEEQDTGTAGGRQRSELDLEHQGRTTLAKVANIRGGGGRNIWSKDEGKKGGKGHEKGGTK